MKLNHAWGAIIVTLTLASCQQQTPTRKKMPEFTDDGFSWMEGNNIAQSQFQTPDGDNVLYSNIDMQTGGVWKNCLAIAPNDYLQDSILISMLDTYAVFATIVIPEWQKSYSQGIVVDLRKEKNNEGFRADYNVSRKGLFSFPLIMLWDGTTALRASNYINKIENVHFATINKVN